LKLTKHEETTMKILGLLKADESMEAGAPPDPDLIARMGSFMEEV
jgi:hypothetical protein